MRLIKIAISIMSVLIVIGLIAVVWRIASLGGGPEAVASSIALGLGPDCTIASAAIENRRATVTVAGAPSCAGIYLVDLSTGEILTIIRP